MRPHGLVHGILQNTGVGSLSLSQGIFATEGSNPGLLHRRQTLYQLSHKGSLATKHTHICTHHTHPHTHAHTHTHTHTHTHAQGCMFPCPPGPQRDGCVCPRADPLDPAPWSLPGHPCLHRSLAIGTKAGYKLFSLSSVEQLDHVHGSSKCVCGSRSIVSSCGTPSRAPERSVPLQPRELSHLQSQHCFRFKHKSLLPLA